jgi:hypothetical protein
MIRSGKRVIATLWCLALTSPVAAQERPARPAADPKACAQEQRLQPGERGPRVPSQSGGSLTDKLARSDGVLCPPEMDSAIKTPTPEAGKTPVLPPPGGPGSDQDVRPK